MPAPAFAVAGRNLQNRRLPFQPSPARRSVGKSKRSVTMSTMLLADPIYREHLQGVRGHPERPERYDFILNALSEAKLLAKLERVESRAATTAELELCHKSDYLRIAKQDVEAGRRQLSTGDTDITPNS